MLIELVKLLYFRNVLLGLGVMGALVQHNNFCLKLPFKVWVLLELLFVDSAEGV